MVMFGSSPVCMQFALPHLTLPYHFCTTQAAPTNLRAGVTCDLDQLISISHRSRASDCVIPQYPSRSVTAANRAAYWSA